MKRCKAFIFWLHRITGTIISLFLLMWFITGLVLIYHSFPNVSAPDKYKHMSVLPDSLPSVNTVLEEAGETQKQIKNLSVTYFQDQVLFALEKKDTTTYITPNEESKAPITKQTLLNIGSDWVNAPIIKIDTLTERDIWIMYSKYDRELPIYKLHFDDDLKHQLYISSRTGEIQQFTNKDERFWAWIGSIPHKFYVPALRKHTDAWVWALTIGGIIGLLGGITGMILGINVLYRNYKNRHQLTSPYKKRWYRWHHILGLFFGIFVITFSFSGAMALQRIPQWVIKTHGDYRASDSKVRGKQLPLDHYKLDYNLLKKHYPAIKSIEWSHFQDIPIYNIIVDDKTLCIDASSDSIKELQLTENQIIDAIKKVHEPTNTYKIKLINEYEEYYLSRKNELPLPVYKVEVDNEDKSNYYVNPATGKFKYVNKTNRVKKWVFSGLHYLNIKFLIERPLLWNILLWILCIGGILFSLTGVVLSFKYTFRKIKYTLKRIKTK